MSPKELLYIEDALGHTQFLMTQARDAANTLQDPTSKQQAQRGWYPTEQAPQQKIDQLKQKYTAANG